MRNKILAALLAGGLLVGAGLITSVVSAPSVASAQDDTSGDEPEGFIQRGLAFLSDVLSGLVGDGTIDQDQADAILAATEAKAAEVKANREEIARLTMSLLEDGVITSEEATQLPEQHPFFGEAYDDAWADGELTVEEIRAIHPHPRWDAFKKGARFGAILDDGGIDQAEYDQLIENLPADHPLAQADVSEYLSDGLITFAELREIFAEYGPGDGPWGGRFHPFGEDAGESSDTPAA